MLKHSDNSERFQWINGVLVDTEIEPKTLAAQEAWAGGKGKRTTVINSFVTRSKGAKS